MKPLYIVDASGYLYRSYFAIRNITNDRGESTNALFGFIRSIQKLRKDFSPEYLIAVFDGPHNAKSRKAIYSDYKAHRASMPPDLNYQIEWAKICCDLMGIPQIAVPEVEADDTMASIALWASQHTEKVYLCTSDKDMCQIVNDKIHILNTFKENAILGPQHVEEAFGVPPEKMIDFLAITGDSSDNVPGLPGLGPKSASALLKEFGSLDYLLAHPECVSGKKQEILRNGKELALLSRQLVTVHKEVEFPKEMQFFSLKPFEKEPLKQFYASMNFNSLIRELEQIPSPEKPSQHIEEDVSTNYRLIEDLDSLEKLLQSLTQNYSEIGISTLADNTQAMKANIIGLALSPESHEAWFIPFQANMPSSAIIEKLKPFFSNPLLRFFGHNIKFDVELLRNLGISLSSISFDTMLASYLLNSHHRHHSLDALMLELFSKTQLSLSELMGKGKKAIPLSQLSLDQLKQFACEAVDYITRLKQLFALQLKERHLDRLLFDLELPLTSVLADMEQHGIFVDIPYLNQMSHEIQNEISSLSNKIFDMAGAEFNLNSPKQLSEILFVRMGIRPPKKTATGLSTSAEVLEMLSSQYPIATLLLEYRTLEKLRSTYVDCLPLEVNPKTQRIHCTFNQTVAATGRLSCQDPNLQNIPIRSEIGRKIRGAFRPQQEGWSYLAADYSQIELRLLAHLSEDPQLIDAFQHGKDIHTHTAATIFHLPLSDVTKALRERAKAVNFGIVYGQQAFGLSQQLGTTLKEASQFIESYFTEYKRVREFVEECKEKTRQSGRSTTATGRERLIPEIHSKNIHIRSAAERLAINTPLQGLAADLIKLAMLKIDQKLQKNHFKSFLILQIHDELVFECPDSEISKLSDMVKNEMQEVMQLKVPLIVDISVGKNWASC